MQRIAISGLFRADIPGGEFRLNRVEIPPAFSTWQLFLSMRNLVSLITARINQIEVDPRKCIPTVLHHAFQSARFGGKPPLEAKLLEDTFENTVGGQAPDCSRSPSTWLAQRRPNP